MIREATPKDAPAMTVIMRTAVEAAGQAGAYDADDIAAWLTSCTESLVRERMGQGRAWVVEIDGEVAAFIVVIGNLVDILYTAPDQMRSGHASALLAHVQQEYHELETEASRLSEPVFARAGFVSLGLVERNLAGRRFYNQMMRWRRSLFTDP